jgi:small subunit ribosomal protein S6
LRDDIQRVRKYELMTIFVPELPEEELQAAITRVSDILTGAEGTVSIINREAPWGRRRLAYPIRHGSRDVRDGFYALYYVELDSQSVLEVERDLKLMDNLMRYLITQQVAEAMIPQSEADEAEERAAEEAVAAGIIPGGIVAAPEASEPASVGEAPPVEATDTTEGVPAAEPVPEEAVAADDEAGESTEISDAAPAETVPEGDVAEASPSETIQAEEVADIAPDEPVQAEEVAESGDVEAGDGETPADAEAASDPVESEDATDASSTEVGEDVDEEGKE